MAIYSAEILDISDANIVTGGAVGDQAFQRNVNQGFRPLFVPTVLAAETTFSMTVTLDAASGADLDGFKVKIIMKGAKKSVN